jgi:hypothetical protein
MTEAGRRRSVLCVTDCSVLRTFKAVDNDADSVDGFTADSAKLHLRALEILNEQGKGVDYTADEYMLAVEQAQGAAA